MNKAAGFDSVGHIQLVQFARAFQGWGVGQAHMKNGIVYSKSLDAAKMYFKKQMFLCLNRDILTRTIVDRCEGQ